MGVTNYLLTGMILQVSPTNNGGPPRGHRRLRKSPGRSDREIRTQQGQVRTRRKVPWIGTEPTGADPGRGTFFVREGVGVCDLGLAGVLQTKGGEGSLYPHKKWEKMLKLPGEKIDVQQFFGIYKKNLGKL